MRRQLYCRYAESRFSIPHPNNREGGDVNGACLMAIREIEDADARFGWKIEKVFFTGSDYITKPYYIGTVVLPDEEETEVQRSGETAAQALNAALRTAQGLPD